MKKKVVVLVVALLLVLIFALAGCMPKDDGLLDAYTIPQIDLNATAMPSDIGDEYKGLYGYDIVDDGGTETD